jgi:hypothetical protein
MTAGSLSEEIDRGLRLLVGAGAEVQAKLAVEHMQAYGAKTPVGIVLKWLGKAVRARRDRQLHGRQPRPSPCTRGQQRRGPGSCDLRGSHDHPPTGLRHAQPSNGSTIGGNGVLTEISDQPPA